MHIPAENWTRKRAAAFIAAAVMAASLSFPALAFAEVKVDETILSQGENAVGGGTATLADSVLDMVNVVANTMTITDESITVNFNGGNEMKGTVSVDGSSDVTMNFANSNDVEDFSVAGNSTLTVNANGHDDLEELKASGNSNLIVNVTGENDFEEIVGTDNANVTIQGTDCQLKDIVNVKDDDRSFVVVENGNLTIDHVTMKLDGDKLARVGSMGGSVTVDTSKIEAEDGALTWLYAGGAMSVSESVIEFAGEMFSRGLMTIEHSDVEVSKSEAAESEIPYRVFSYEGIKLIAEKNGEVRDGEYNGKKVWYVDTDDNDGFDVDLKADGKPGYYKCKPETKAMPSTGDNGASLPFTLLATIGLISAAYATRRRSRI